MLSFRYKSVYEVMIEFLLKIFFLVNNEIVRCENYKSCLCMIYILFNSFQRKLLNVKM